MRTVRVCVVGAGPAGLYTAEALRDVSGLKVEVDFVDRLPTPFGLLRYGVAPDHLKMKSLTRGLQRVLEDSAVRFFGDVEMGRDLSVQELRTCYDAVVYAYGAPEDRRLDIPGEDLRGSAAARSFVAWYSGHPDHEIADVILDAREVAVLGMGNVAVDVARVLLKDPSALAATDIPEGVLHALYASSVSDVHVIGRRGPAQARWTNKELSELGELDGVDVVVNAHDLALDDASAAVVAADPSLARNLAVLRGWAGAPPSGARRRLHLHFWSRPVCLLGTSTVTGLRLALDEPDGAGGAQESGRVAELSASLVLRSVGYLGRETPGIPFEEGTGRIPCDQQARVLRDGVVSVGEYAAGWARRGASGVIGTNRPDGELVALSLVEDAKDLSARPDPGDDALPALLRSRSRHPVDLAGWAAIDDAERSRGREQGRDRLKLASWAELRQAVSCAACPTAR